jgi:hypothetical protein
LAGSVAVAGERTAVGAAQRGSESINSIHLAASWPRRPAARKRRGDGALRPAAAAAHRSSPYSPSSG